INDINQKTNGPLWSEYLAKAWGLQLKSYATLGARVCRATDIYSPSVANQVEEYKSSYLEKNKNNKSEKDQLSRDVHAFFIGITDITNSTRFEERTLIGCVKQQIASITASNPKAQILLLSIPPLESSPFYMQHHLRDDIKQRITSYNIQLEDTVTDIKEDMGPLAPIVFVDNNFLFGDILGNPAGYGIEDVENAYWDQCQGRCNTSMNSYLWWDKIHLTGAGHKAIADNMIDSNPFHYQINKDYNNNDGQSNSYYSINGFSGENMKYATYFLLLCFFGFLVLIFQRKYGLSLYLKSLWKRKRNHAYTPVPV
ncbi:hypothetical protein BJ944DRAFT_264903, partial [Cunninghamella echinulata]